MILLPEISQKLQLIYSLVHVTGRSKLLRPVGPIGYAALLDVAPYILNWVQLVVTDTDACEFWSTCNVISQLRTATSYCYSFRLSPVIIFTLKSVCSTASRSYGGVYSETMATGLDRMGRVQQSFWKVALASVSVIDAVTSKGTARLPTPPKSTRTCRLQT